MTTNKEIDIQDLDPEVGERIEQAFMPTKGTLFKRRCIITQLFQMIGFNAGVLSASIKGERANKKR